MNVLIFDIARRIGIAIAIKWATRFNPLLLIARWQYKNRVSTKLIEMPFLFKDMNLSAKDDYVALDVLTIQVGRVRAPDKVRSDYSGPMPKFEAYRRALIFGDGGYGKTTLLRNLALKCLAKNRFQKIFGKRGVLPIYLPLKIVKTSLEFPIIEAIQASDPYLSGRRGLKRISKLGSSGKLVVLLDGYDEIPYAGGFEPVRRDLAFILAGSGMGLDSITDSPTYRKSRFYKAYKAIQKSRVYLSSRMEFFDYNPIMPASDVQSWIVRGLDDRRIELVERIFAKYRVKTMASSGRDLNSELFLQELSKTEDEGMISLSRSPLFLTVMCYVYVMDSGSPANRIFSLSARALAKTCIQLLLEDLDEYKSRGFSDTERKAIKNRRSAYIEEKYSFLSYFAVKTYERNVGYFDETFITSEARIYFSQECCSVYSAEILRGLSSDDPTSNIAKQIIYSGLFVLIDKHGDVAYFDFPHRRFREVLAVEYFSSPGKVEALIAAATNKSYAELILVFIEQSHQRQVVIRSLIGVVAKQAATSHVINLLIDALGRVPPSEAEMLVMEFFDAVEDMPSLALPTEVVRFFSHNEVTWRYVRSKLLAALDGKSPESISRWTVIAGRVNRVGAAECVNEWEYEQASFATLRSVIFSPLCPPLDSPFVAHFIRIGVEAAERVVTADIMRVFFIGRSEFDKANFHHWLDQNCELQDSYPKASELFLRLRRFMSDEMEHGEEAILAGSSEPRLVFIHQ